MRTYREQGSTTFTSPSSLGDWKMQGTATTASSSSDGDPNYNNNNHADGLLTNSNSYHGHNDDKTNEPNTSSARQQQQRQESRNIMINFIIMSLLFSANHGCTVACLSLATARFAAVGAWQSGILYLFYTGSALFGATGVVKWLGPRNGLMAGMALYCFYVGAFWLATIWSSYERSIAYIGAAIGGLGAGFLWTAQGGYFTQCAADHARANHHALEQSTNRLASLFAFIYLTEEVTLRALSSLLTAVWRAPWSAVFAAYAIVALLSTAGMAWVQPLDDNDNDTITNNNDDDDGTSTYLEEYVEVSDGDEEEHQRHDASQDSWWYKSTAAAQLLWRDPAMKYMIGLNAVFGFASAFVNSYINGEVLNVIFDDQDNNDGAKYVGFFTAWMASVAAIMSVVFGAVAKRFGKGPVLLFGAFCFFNVAFPFYVQPNLQQWRGSGLLWLVYTLHGTGRATFEGTLKAVFADFFSYEKEGAFANIILQNGLAGAMGYVFTFALTCDTQSRYCVSYHDGSLHNVGTFEWIVMGSGILAIFGYFRAASIFRHSARGMSALEQDSSSSQAQQHGAEQSNAMDLPGDQVALLGMRSIQRF